MTYNVFGGTLNLSIFFFIMWKCGWACLSFI